MTECKCDGNCGDIPIGWKCPECGKVNGPHVDVCWHEKSGLTPREYLELLKGVKRNVEKDPWKVPTYPGEWYKVPVVRGGLQDNDFEIFYCAG